MLEDTYDICAGTWQSYEHDARFVRTQVFIEEQGICAEDEWDTADATAIHFMVYVDGQPIATARLLADHSVGRVAVLSAYRGRGIGHQLMRYIMLEADRQHLPYLVLSAQVHALAFYQALGFEALGQIYLECGIPHQHMRWIVR